MKHLMQVVTGKNKMLTLEQFTALPDGEVFAASTVMDNANGINITGKLTLLKYVAVKGYVNDWALYVGPADWRYNYVKSNGDKVFSKTAQKIIDCDDEVRERYRP